MPSVKPEPFRHLAVGGLPDQRSDQPERRLMLGAAALSENSAMLIRECDHLNWVVKFQRGKMSETIIGPRWRVKHRTPRITVSGMFDIVGGEDEHEAARSRPGGLCDIIENSNHTCEGATVRTVCPI
jgi:hypothetical protein